MKPLETKIFGSFVVEIHYCIMPSDPRSWGQGGDLDANILKQWQDGEVFGFITKEKGIEIDSCWEFYSFEEAYQAAQENFPTRDNQYFFDQYENL